MSSTSPDRKPRDTSAAAPVTLERAEDLHADVACAALEIEVEQVETDALRALQPLPTKIVPPFCETGTLRRDSIEAVLDGGARITEVTGPAGYGKTTSVAFWASRQRVPVAWYSIDSYDARPSVFWRHVTAAVGRVFPLTPAIEVTDRRLPDGHEAIALLLALGADPGPLVIVLDDAHLVRESALLDQLAYVVDRAPASVRFVLISRVQPSLPWARWAANGHLAEITESQLTMDDGQSAALVRTAARSELDDQLVEHLCDAAAGWPAMLHLVGRIAGLSDRDDDLDAGRLSHDRLVLEYVVSEVLAMLDDEDRDAALLLSLLDELDPRRCELLCGVADGGTLLRKLQRLGVPMISLDPVAGAWRFHALIRDVLASELQHADANRLPEHHARAAQVEVEVGNPSAAVRHLISAGDLDRAFGIVFAPLAELYRAGAIHKMADWIDLFPADFVAGSAGRSAIFALAMGYLGRRKDFELWVKQAHDLALEPSTELDVALTLPRLLAALERGDTATVREEVTALRARQGPEVLDRTRDCHTHTIMAIASLADERLEDSAYWVNAILRWPDMPERVRVAGQPTRAAWEAYLRGSLAESAELARGALESGVDTGNASVHVRLELFSLLSALALERLDLVDAEYWAGRATELGHTMVPSLHRYLADRAAFGVVEASHGPAAASNALAAAIGSPPVGIAQRYQLLAAELDSRAGRSAMAARRLATLPSSPRRSLVAARIAAQTGRADTVEARLRELPPLLDLPREVHIGAELLRAMVSPGSAALERALAAGAPNGYAWTFRREGSTQDDALRLATAPGRPWHDTQLARTLRTTVSQPTVSTIRFSDAEMRVLRLLPSHRSLVEIAEDMFVSINTIKTHVRSIYRKLDVSLRSDAVRRAAELGVLSGD